MNAGLHNNFWNDKKYPLFAQAECDGLRGSAIFHHVLINNNNRKKHWQWLLHDNNSSENVFQPDGIPLIGMQINGSSRNWPVVFLYKVI